MARCYRRDPARVREACKTLSERAGRILSDLLDFVGVESTIPGEAVAHAGVSVTAEALATLSGIPHPAVRRTLVELRDAGYVRPGGNGLILVTAGLLDLLPPPDTANERKRRQRRADVGLSQSDWMALCDAQDNACARCRQLGSYDTLTIDHIVPRSRGGEDAPENIQALCRPCNASKSAALPGEETPRRSHAWNDKRSHAENGEQSPGENCTENGVTSSRTRALTRAETRVTPLRESKIIVPTLRSGTMARAAWIESVADGVEGLKKRELRSLTPDERYLLARWHAFAFANCTRSERNNRTIARSIATGIAALSDRIGRDVAKRDLRVEEYLVLGKRLVERANERWFRPMDADAEIVVEEAVAT